MMKRQFVKILCNGNQVRLLSNSLTIPKKNKSSLLLKYCPVLSSRLDPKSHLNVDGLISLTTRTFTQSLRPYVDPVLSYAYAKSQDHLIYSTVMKEFDKRLDTDDELNIFGFQSENKFVTSKHFDEDVSKIAKTLITKFNIAKGDCVGIYSYNCYNWVVAQFACARIGAIVVPINPSNKAKELLHVLRTSQIKCLFTHGPNSVQAELNNHLEVLKSDIISEGLKSGDLALKNIVFMDSYDKEYDPSRKDIHVVDCHLHTWANCLNNGRIFSSIQRAKAAGVSEDQALLVNLDSVSPDDPFAIYYTSGTTGTPKGASVSHFGALNNARICHGRLRQGLAKNERLVLVTTLPLFHIYAGVLLSFPSLFGDSIMVNSSHKYDVKLLLQSCIDNNANTTALTPTILIDMLTHIEALKLGDKIPLKRVQSGGAFLPKEMVSRAFEVIKNLKEVRIGYGSTENAAVATMQTIHEPDETKSLSVGPPVDFTEVRVVDPSTEVVLPHGQKGEIQTRGHNTMLGYLGQPEKTAEVITAHRWYRTGDIGIMFPHGSIQIISRQKNMIIRGGENIYPEEVAGYILHLPYVENVHVVGVPDERYGEEVCAWIKLKPGYCEASEDRNPDLKPISKQDIIDYCKENMTHFKVPKYFLFVDSFPMTPTKKVQSNIMVQQSIKILGLDKGRK